jgi:hypothetical protein
MDDTFDVIVEPAANVTATHHKCIVDPDDYQSGD